MYVFKTRASSTEQNKVGGRLEAGVYHANVMNAVEKTSKNGKPMAVLTLQVEGGAPVQLTEYLVLTTEVSWKVEQFLASTGLKFGKGEDLEFDPAAQVGKHVVIETCNERGEKGGLFPKVLRFVQASLQKDVPRGGHVFTAEDLAERGLDANGCSNSAGAPAKAAPKEQQQPQKGAPAPLPNENEDDIPF